MSTRNTHASRLPRKTSFAEEVARPEHPDDRLLAGSRQHSQLDASLLDVEHVGGGIPLRKATIVKLHDQISEARTLAAGENPVGHVIAFWVLSWKNAHGGTYELTKQDAANLKRLVNQHGLEELEGRMIRYLGDSDPWFARQEHPLSIFVARVNGYHVAN